MTGNGWLGIIFTGGVSAVLAILAWVLRRSERALSNSSTAITLTNSNIKSTGEHMMLIEKLRQAIYLQGNGLDDWEDWGVVVKRRDREMQRKLQEHGWIKEITELPDPPKHLDLTHLFQDLPQSGPNSATPSGAESTDG